MSNPTPSPSIQYSTLNKVQRLAALMVMLGPESAANLLKGFSQQEVDGICAEMAKMEIIPLDVQREILKEFSDVAVEAGTAIRGGIEFARTSLERAVGQFKANEVINRVVPARPPLVAVDSISELEARQLYNLLSEEQPQTIALVLSYLSPDRAAELTALFPAPKRDAVIERLATLAPIPVEVVEKVIKVLSAKAGARQTRALNQTGGVKTAADILNALGRPQSKESLGNIEKLNPQLAKAIEKNMFVFEDLKNVDPSVLQRVLRDIDMGDLALALKTASEELRTLILGCISKRAAEGVREEIAFLSGVKPKEVDVARQKIIDAAKSLAAESEGAESSTAEPTPDEALHVAA